MDEDQLHKGLRALTGRQLEVLRRFCRGMKYSVIAKELGITESAIKAHMGDVYERLGLVIFPAQQRRRIIFQDVCPALSSLELGEAPQEEGEAEPVPEETARMVDDDEKAKVLWEEPIGKVVPQPDEKPKGRRCRNVMIGVAVGLGLGVVVTAAGLWALGLLRGGADDRAASLEATLAAMQEDAAASVTTDAGAAQAPGEVAVVAATSTPLSLPSPSPIPPSPFPTYPPPPAFLFEDDFEDGLSPAWQVVYGNPVVVNGMLSADRDTLLVVGDASWENYDVEFDADVADCWMSGYVNFIGVRFLSEEDMIVFAWGDCEGFWYEVVGGEWREVPNSGCQPGYGMLPFKVQAKSEQFAVWVNHERISSFFSSILSSGKVGFRLGANTLIDNFRVSRVD